MKQTRLNLYQIDIKYIRDLSKADDRVMSTSPQIGKENRPFIGIIIVCDNKKYCIPFSSPKPKHSSMKNDVDFTKMYNNDRLPGVLNFNNMIPVNESVIKPLNIRPNKNDPPDVRRYKKLSSKQLNWCQQHTDDIVSKANKLYYLVTEKTDPSRNLIKRCCDFKRLEAVLEKWKKIHGIDNTI